MSRSAIQLAEGFPPASREEWLALVKRTLKGGDVEALVTPATDGLQIQPLYEASRAPRSFAAAPRGGERPWDIRARVRHPNLTMAGDAVLDDLAGGVSSVIVAMDWGLGEGVAIASADDLARVLDGVLIDVAPVALDAGFLAATSADWLSAAAKGSPAAPLALHMDPLSALARLGRSPGPIESHLISCANAAARLAPIHPKASYFLASGAVTHEAGGTPAQELAFALSAAVNYLKAMARAGMDLETAAGGIVLGLTTDNDPLVSIAKLRAARIVWARVANVCSVPPDVVIEARSSLRMLTCIDPWTNMVRLTTAAFAAVVGGADAIVTGAFTDALGLPTAFARRMARDTQLILMDEGNLGAVADPVAGAGAFEELTVNLARAAWTKFNAIEAAGGLLAALRDGLISREVMGARANLSAAIADRKFRVVGLTDYRGGPSRPVAFEESPAGRPDAPIARLPGPDSHCDPLTPTSVEELAE